MIFAFGGTVLIATSLYVVQRISRARLAGEIAPWPVVLGYNLFIVIAATCYLLGITRRRNTPSRIEMVRTEVVIQGSDDDLGMFEFLERYFKFLERYSTAQVCNFSGQPGRAITRGMRSPPISKCSDPNSALGASQFQAYCAACHGENADGMQEIGAPNLTNDIWLYWSDRASIIEGNVNGRRGVMPYFCSRLDDATVKALAVYSVVASEAYTTL